MSFRSIRDASHLSYADSFTQDMDFWRQRVQKEQGRQVTPSLFSGEALHDLPRNPFKDSAGMLKGNGVSMRSGATELATELGVLKP